MSTPAERAARRRRTWSAQLYTVDAASAMERDDLAEWAAMEPSARLALAWQLSLEQYGGADADALEPRLPRSAYRVERR
jgi:hypothetical protein